MPSLRLKDKVAIITGAASGIGAAHARLFAAHGAKVLIADIDEGRGRDVQRGICESGGNATCFALDVTDADAWRKALAFTINDLGTPTTLVNCAGVASSAGVTEETLEGWTKVIAVNQTGTWLGMKTVLPALLSTGNAAIVNISSMLGVIGSPRAFAYQASKGALRQMTRSVALEYANRGVRANTVCPGVIATPMSSNASDEARKYQIESTPMKRLGQVDEVAYCSLFLCSDEASYITAADFLVDGGTSAA